MKGRSRRLAVAVAALTVAASVAAPDSLGRAPAVSAAVALYTANVSNVSKPRDLRLGADGTHHLLLSGMVVGFHPPVSYYVSDATGAWTPGDPTHELDGEAQDFALGPGDVPYVLTKPSDLHVRVLVAGSWTNDSVPVPISSAHSIGAMAVDGSGVVHVAFAAFSGFAPIVMTVYYTERTAAGWSALEAIAPAGMPLPTGPGPDFSQPGDLAVVLDGSGRPHVLVSGSRGTLAACATACLADVSRDDADTWSVTAVAEPIGTIEAVRDGATIDALVTSSGGIAYRSDDLPTATWMPSEAVAAGQTTGGSIAIGPSGPVAFYSPLPGGGVERVDRVGGGWSGPVEIGAPGDTMARGVVDADNTTHVAFSKKYMDSGQQYDATWMTAPDDKGPSVTEILGVPRVGSTVSTASRSPVSTQIAWVSHDALSGVAHDEVQERRDSGSWVTVAANVTTPLLTRVLADGSTYSYRVRSVDHAGNVGPWRQGRPIRYSWYQESSSNLVYGGSTSTAWSTLSLAKSSGGKVRTATHTGDWVGFVVDGAGFAYISPKGPTLTSAMITIDDAVGAINLHAATATAPTIVFAQNFIGRGKHVVFIEVMGTQGTDKSPFRIYVDAILVIPRLTSPGAAG